MIKILTAMNNSDLYNELKKEKNVLLIGRNIQYKEGILEKLEKIKEINYIILDSKLLGEIKLNDLIEEILNKNNKIKIIITIEKTDKNKIKINNKKIIKIFYENEIKLKDLKEYNKIEKNKKIISVLGAKQSGKSILILQLVYYLNKNNYKILIINKNKESIIFYNLLKYTKKRFNTKKLKNKIKTKKYIGINQKKIILKKQITKIKKNIYILNHSKLINKKIIREMSSNFSYIFIEFSEKELYKFNNKILIINPNKIGINMAKKIIEKNKLKNYFILINKYNEYSIDVEIIKKILKNKNILEIFKYKKLYEKYINNNLNIKLKRKDSIKIKNIIDKINNE